MSPRKKRAVTTPRSQKTKAKVSPTPYQLMPVLDRPAFRALKADIAKHGVRVPIERDERGAILDGHHRVRAIDELRAEGVVVADPPVIVRGGFTEDEKRAHVRALNLYRRHLSAAQRRAVVRAQLLDTPDRSDRSIARQFGTSHVTVGRVRSRVEEEEPYGTGSLNQFRTRVGDDGKRRRLPVRPAQRTILAADEREAKRAMRAFPNLGPRDAAVLSWTDARRAALGAQRQRNRDQTLRELREPGPLTLDGGRRYSVLYADPPWRYDDGATDPSREVSNQYPPMALEDIAALPVGEMAATDAVLFLWTTAPKLHEAMTVIEAWNFKYKSGAVWSKVIAGMGSWGFRIAHEHLLVAVRGSMLTPAPATRVNSVITIKRGKHSAKPPEIRRLIDTFYPNVPKLELFARTRVRGWHSWGNQLAPNGVGARPRQAHLTSAVR